MMGEGTSIIMAIPKDVDGADKSITPSSFLQNNLVMVAN